MFIGDVSSHNTITNWSAYVADTPAVWVKATQASGSAAYTNPSFASQFTGAVSVGGLAGAYHFADPRFSASADADHFIEVANRSGAFADGRLLPLLDVEDTPQFSWSTTANTWIADFIRRYRQVTGRRKIIVYASRSFWQTILHPDAWVDGDIYLMVAAYPGAVDWSKGLNQSGYSHPRLAVWQYTDAAPIAGMAAPGDRSRQVAFTAADLTLGARPAPVPAPIEGDDEDMALTPVLFRAGARPDVNNGKPLYPFGVWRDELGVYVGLASDAERDLLLKAFPAAVKGDGDGVWVEQPTLAEWVRISRVGVDTPVPTAGGGTSAA